MATKPRPHLQVGTSSRALHYKAQRTTYEEKSTDVILGRVIAAEEVAQTVRRVAEQVDSNYAQNTLTIDHMVALFKSSHDVGLPEDKRYVGFDAKSSKAPDIIFRVLGMLDGPVQPNYIAPAGSGKDRDRAAKIEEHLSHLYPWMMRKYQTRWDIQNRFWQLLAGRSYLQQTYLPFYWDREILARNADEKLSKGDNAAAITSKNTAFNERVAGYKGYAGPAFFVENLDPRTTFPVMTPQGPEAWVKIYRVERYELDESFAKVGKKLEFDRGGKRVLGVADLEKPGGQILPRQTSQTSKTGAIDYYEYIDDVMTYYVVGGEVVHKVQHDGGMKIFPAYGLQTGFKEFNLAAVGLLWAVRNEIPQYDFMRTLWLQKAYLDVFPQLFAQLPDNGEPLVGEDGKPEKWQIEPMTVKQIRGTLINALKEAGSGTDFRAVVEMLAADIDLATIPGIARGVAGMQQPGYAINQLRQILSNLWKPAIESAEEQMSALYEHYLWCVKNIVKDVCTVFGQFEDPDTGRLTGDYFEVSPDDIQDYFRVSAKLEPDLPIDKQGTMMSYAQLAEKGYVDFDMYAREGLGISNPVPLKRRIFQDLAERAMLPDAINDATALGRVKLQNATLKAYGMDKGNSLANIDLMALKAGQSQQPAPGGTTAPPDAGGGAPAGQPPPGIPAPVAGLEAPPAVAGGGAPIPLANGVQVAGANPANATPGPRR